MALSNYNDLLASVATWLNRTDLTAVIPDFVTIAESKIARDLRLRNQITASTLSTSATTRAVALPAGWIAFSSVTVGATPPNVCEYVTTERLDTLYQEQGGSGRPFVYSIEGSNILFGPTPDAVYPVNVNFYQRFPALVSASTNWLLTNHPNVYLYACLREGAFYTKDQAGAQQWDGLYKQETSNVQKDDDQATHSGSTLTVKTV